MLSLFPFIALPKFTTFNGFTISADTAYATTNGSPLMVANHNESPTKGIDAEGKPISETLNKAKEKVKDAFS